MDIFLGTLFIVVCILLVVVVLLQKGRGGGLGSVFGGAGSSAFGTRTGDVFTWITIVLTITFLLLAMGSTLYFRPTPGQVATPKVKPPGGIVDGPQPAFINCSTRGAKLAVTLDGSAPTEDKADRTTGGTVTVRPGQTLKVRAYLRNWKPSELVSVTYVQRPAALAPAPTTAPGEPAPAKPQ